MSFPSDRDRFAENFGQLESSLVCRYAIARKDDIEKINIAGLVAGFYRISIRGEASSGHTIIYAKNTDGTGYFIDANSGFYRCHSPKNAQFVVTYFLKQYDWKIVELRLFKVSESRHQIESSLVCRYAIASKDDIEKINIAGLVAGFYRIHICREASSSHTIIYAKNTDGTGYFIDANSVFFRCHSPKNAQFMVTYFLKQYNWKIVELRLFKVNESRHQTQFVG